LLKVGILSAYSYVNQTSGCSFSLAGSGTGDVMEAQRTGKSKDFRLAKPARHEASPRSSGPLIKLINLPAINPDDVDDHSLYLRDLVDGMLPIVGHVVRYNHLQAYPQINIFWLDPHLSLDVAGRQLLEFLASVSGSRTLWVPLSSSHSALVNAMSMVLPGLQCLDLSSVVMVYIGDQGNCVPLRRISGACKMPFYFQASLQGSL
jgi:hypothetical protein